MNHTVWVNQFFYTFIKDSEIKLYFEEKDKLNSNEKILNLSIHPIRFADDIFFNFETNDSLLREKLKKYEVNYNLFYHYADTLKATCLQNYKKKSIKENALLIVGQTEKDKVVFDGTKYLSIVDYVEELKSLQKFYKYIYFKPHPYAQTTNKIVKLLKKELKNITVVYDNIYYLLSNDNVKHVVGLNSSVLYEAKYFRKEVTFLYKEYFDIGKKDIGIYGNYFESSFWADVLEEKDLKLNITFQSNRLRKCINGFWGYNEVSNEIILKDILKNKIRYFLLKYIR